MERRIRLEWKCVVKTDKQGAFVIERRQYLERTPIRIKLLGDKIGPNIKELIMNHRIDSEVVFLLSMNLG